MTGPALSNYLAVLAVEVAGEIAAYRRGSHAAHVAYLAAGAKLAEARESARRGEWGPFLAACGIEARTARHMMTLARSGLTADDLTAAGGVRAALESLRPGRGEPEKTETVSGIASPEPDPEIGHSGRFDGPDPAERRPVVHETGLAGPEPRSVQAGAPGRTLEAIYRDRDRDRSSLQGAQVPDRAADAEAFLETDPARGLNLYAWRRARGLCTVCEAPATGARCEGCAGELNRKRRSRTRIASGLAPRIEAAAKAGRGVRLTAADVARLAGKP